MKKLIVIFLTTISVNVFSQTPEQKKQQDSINAVTAAADKYVDSVLKKISVSDLRKWMEDNATVTQYKEIKFLDAYNSFIQYQVQLFLQNRQKQKPKQ